jgi:hypothetical protein
MSLLKRQYEYAAVPECSGSAADGVFHLECGGAGSQTGPCAGGPPELRKRLESRIFWPCVKKSETG